MPKPGMTKMLLTLQLSSCVHAGSRRDTIPNSCEAILPNCGAETAVFGTESSMRLGDYIAELSNYSGSIGGENDDGLNKWNFGSGYIYFRI